MSDGCSDMVESFGPLVDPLLVPASGIATGAAAFDLTIALASEGLTETVDPFEDLLGLASVSRACRAFANVMTSLAVGGTETVDIFELRSG